MGKDEQESNVVEQGNLPDLSPTTADYVSSAVKSLVGAVPFVGSLMAEIAGTIIPNQRMERVIDYAKRLEERLSGLDQDLIRSKLTDENFTDLMEEGMRQAARSLTDERREYIASIIATGLSSEDIEFIESKHLLRLLGELNDIEVLILRFYLNPFLSGDDEFREKHKSVVRPKSAYIGCPQEVADKATLHGSYRSHLASLGLLESCYREDRKTGLPAFSSVRHTFERSGYELTSLGRLLLHQIGLGEDDPLRPNRPSIEVEAGDASCPKDQ